MLYLITYIDKTNIGKPFLIGMELLLGTVLMILGNAKIEGLLPSLHMDGVQYNVALSIFFVPYVLAGSMPNFSYTWALRLISSRGPKQYDIEPFQTTFDVSWIPRPGLGNNHDPHRCRAKL